MEVVMKCKTVSGFTGVVCGLELEVYQDMVSTDVLKGNWEGNIYHVYDQKDTGESEITDESLMCPNGHTSLAHYKLGLW
jgi:hypothetical protein